MKTSESSSAWQPFLEAAAQYRGEWEGIESTLDELLAEVDLLQLKLEQKETALSEAQELLAKEKQHSRRLQRQLEQQEAEFSGKVEQPVRQSRSESESTRSPCSPSQLEVSDSKEKSSAALAQFVKLQKNVASRKKRR